MEMQFYKIEKEMMGVINKTEQRIQNEVLGLMINTAKTITEKIFIKGFQEYYPESFNSETINTIYKAIFLKRVGDSFSVSVNSSLIKLKHTNKQNTNSFWAIEQDNQFLEEDDDFEDIDEFDDNIVTEDLNSFEPYNRQNTQGNKIPKKLLCDILYKESMDQFNKEMRGSLRNLVKNKYKIDLMKK